MQLLETLGLRTSHFEKFHDGVDLAAACEGHETDHQHILNIMRPLIASRDCLSDVPFPVLYRLLAAEYPTAKFVLLYRDPLEWAISVNNHVGRRGFHVFERAQYWHYFPTKPQRLKDIGLRHLLRMKLRHTAEAVQFFNEEAPGRLFVAPLSSQNVATAIASFLERHIDNTPLTMPHIKSKHRKKKRKVPLTWRALDTSLGRILIDYDLHKRI